MNFGRELKDLVRNVVGALDGNAFQKAMKENHALAMENIPLLRRTTSHNVPVTRHEIDPWLRRDAGRRVRRIAVMIGWHDHGSFREADTIKSTSTGQGVTIGRVCHCPIRFERSLIG
jgi:hypothetical protein